MLFHAHPRLHACCPIAISQSARTLTYMSDEHSAYMMCGKVMRSLC